MISILKNIAIYIVVVYILRVLRKSFPFIDIILFLVLFGVPIYVWINSHWFNAFVSFILLAITWSLIIVEDLNSSNSSTTSTGFDSSTRTTTSYKPAGTSRTQWHPRSTYNSSSTDDTRREETRREETRRQEYDEWMQKYRDYMDYANNEYDRYIQCKEQKEVLIEAARDIERSWNNNENSHELSVAQGYLDQAKSYEYDEERHLSEYNRYKDLAHEAEHEADIRCY